MKKLTAFIIPGVFVAMLGLSIAFTSCDPETTEDVITALGWLFENEDTTTIPDDINLATAYGDESLPASVDLSMYFPPIGNQGQYGTCVAWACGYNLRSYLNARANDLTTDDMIYSANVFSPKDLFWAIPNSEKGADCNGTQFESALDVMVSRGIARMSVVPYSAMGNCSSSPSSDWTSDAGNYKILNYRQIDQTVDNIKRYLYQGKAVVFGAKLGDEFMNASGDVVLTSQTYGYTGQHAYHALILCGYDDNKGPNGAFRVVNSWGTGWGDDGYIWVDYNYFVQQDYFAFASFVASNIEDEPDLDNPTSGYDLQAWELNDIDDSEQTDATYREALYNVYNTGENSLNASSDWNILYMYYNAYNANDYGIILYDMYTDNYGSYGFFDRPDPVPSDVPAADYWATYLDFPGQTSIVNEVARQLYGNTAERFSWKYQMPQINGYYYLILIADGFDAFSEFNEDNNYFYYAYENGDPLYIVNGVIQGPPAAKMAVKNSKTPVKGASSDFQSVRIGKNVNAYSTGEIRKLIDDRRQSGAMARKVMQWQNSDAAKKVSKSIK
ncbi:MAG: C1 family peptidase [Bacteroidales bacterium]|nr:C1 family peptidase [Bacteroidales bacterium]HQP04969.1 C1 family peptidase [Bacteroidales bacterium]